MPGSPGSSPVQLHPLKPHDSTTSSGDTTGMDNRTSISADTSKMKLLEGEKSEEPLIERVAKEVVTVDSYVDAREGYDKRTFGEKILLIGPDWEDNIRFKKNQSDIESFEQEDLIRDYEDLNLEWLFKHDENTTKEIITDWMEVTSTFSLEDLFQEKIDLFNEDEIDKDKLEMLIDNL